MNLLAVAFATTEAAAVVTAGESAEGVAKRRVDEGSNDPYDDTEDDESNDNGPNECPEVHWQVQFFAIRGKIFSLFFLKFD